MESARRMAPASLAVVLALGLAALAARVLVFALFPHPAYPDSSYYTSAAREIAAGHGMVMPYLWSFTEVGGGIPLQPTLTPPSFGQWMPLASFIQLPFIALLGPTDTASALPFILIGALLAPLTYLFARDVLGPGREMSARAAGLILVLPGGLSAYLGQADNFALFALVVLGTWWFTLRARRNGRVLLWVAAGVCAGLTFLSRNDGLVVIGALGLVALTGLRRGRDLRPLVGTVAGVFIVVAPWLARQMLTFGTLSPAGASGRILWARTYTDSWGADGPLTPAYLFGEGIGPVLAGRLDAITYMAVTSFVLIGAGILVPLVAAGIARSRLRDLEPYALWAALFFVWEIVVAAPMIAAGNFLHSALALMPLAAILMVEALAGMVTALAHRGLSPRAVGAILGGPAIGALFLVGILTSAFGTSQQWSDIRSGEIAVGTWIKTQSPGDPGVVMSGDPGGFWVTSSITGLRTPTPTPASIEPAARAYGVRWLVIDELRPVEGLEGLVDGIGVPDWLEGPLYRVDTGVVFTVYTIRDAGS